jgi:hypothetical protein
MSKLAFSEQHGYIIDPSKTKPVNEDELNKFKIKIEKELSQYIDKINACGGKVEITINQDGKSFTSRLVNIQEDLYNQIIDELNSK